MRQQEIQTLTTATYLPWEDLTGLLLKLKRDDEHKFRLLIGIGCMTGLRISDILKLSWGLLLEQPQVVIVEGKTKKRRIIIINQDLQKLIKECHEELRPKVMDAPIFLNKYGTQAIRIQWINVKLKQLFKKYGLPTNGVSSHLLRKTFGRAIWSNNGHSDEALIKLSEIFSHSSVAITRRYLGLRQEELDSLYEELKL